MMKLAYDGQPQQFEFWGKRAGGEYFLKDVRLRNGVYFGQKVIVAMAHDITIRKETELALQNKVDELERMNKLLIGEQQQLARVKREVNELLVKCGEQEKYTTN